MLVGQVIRNARKALGMTQQELGDRMGVQKSAVAKWENGRVSNMGRDNIKKLATILNISPYDLVAPEIINPDDDSPILHARILRDSTLLSAIRDYYKLSADDRNMVLNLIHSLAAKTD